VRILLGLLVVFLVAVAAPLAQCQTKPAHKLPFSLTLVGPTSPVESGERVYIKITMKNLANHDVDSTPCYGNGIDRADEFDIPDSNGKRLETWWDKHPEIGHTGSPPPHTLKPGETHESGQVITDLYDMTQPGDYTIQVSRRISNNSKDGVVKSNKVTVTIFRMRKPPPPPAP
jgi:hypothetical protein